MKRIITWLAAMLGLASITSTPAIAAERENSRQDVANMSACILGTATSKSSAQHVLPSKPYPVVDARKGRGILE